MSRRRLLLIVAMVVVAALLVARGIAWPPGRYVPSGTASRSAALPSLAVPPTADATASPCPPPSTGGVALGSGREASATAPRASVSAVDASQLDPRVTQATVAQTIGVPGWSKRVRPPQSVTEPIKLRLMREHHYTDSPHDYELDHFIPLEVGGSSNLSNLWLEPIGEARLKDKDENLAHREVVSGAWTLAQGQQYMRNHWRIHYRQ